jgi:hypothetical protein
MVTAHRLSEIAKIMLLVVTILGGPASHAGGWATAVLSELPEFAVRNEPVTVTFAIKQHGIQPLKALSIRISANNISTGENRNFGVSELRDGLYTSELNFPSPGTWDWEIKTGWPGPSAMPRIEVIEPSEVWTQEITRYQKGASVFVAKGCITCHKNTRIQLDNAISLQIGIDLTHYRASPKFLRQWLKNPRSVRPASAMPDQNLSQDDIDALVAFFGVDNS